MNCHAMLCTASHYKKPYHIKSPHITDMRTYVQTYLTTEVRLVPYLHEYVRTHVHTYVYMTIAAFTQAFVKWGYSQLLVN